MISLQHLLAIIATLYEEKGWRGQRIAKELPNKKWVPRSINRLIDKYVKTGSTDRITGSGRPRTARTGENIIEVEDVVQSQEDRPGTHLTQRKIANKLKNSRMCYKRHNKKGILK